MSPYMIFSPIRWQFISMCLVLSWNTCSFIKPVSTIYLSSTVYNSPLELVFVDLWGPVSLESSCGFFIICVDAFSKYTWIYPLKSKSDTFKTITQFKAMIEILLMNHKFKGVKSRRWVSSFDKILCWFGDSSHSCLSLYPSSKWECWDLRESTHIVETGLSLLAHAKLPY